MRKHKSVHHVPSTFLERSRTGNVRPASLLLSGGGATHLLMDQYLVPESAEPLQTPSALTPDGAVPQVPTRRVASGPQGPTLNAGSRIVDLIAGTAKVGVGAATLVAVEITSRSIRIARVVVPASIAEGPLDAVERHLGRRQGEAHRSERENRDNVAEAAESVLNRVVVGVVDMLDMEQLIDHVRSTRLWPESISQE